MFRKYHYLSHSHNNAATVYVGLINNIPVCFNSVLHFPHPKVKNAKRSHRLIVLPDYQGVGIGIKFVNYIANYYVKKGFKFLATLSQPALIQARKKDPNWVMTSFGRIPRVKQNKGLISSSNRITTSWSFEPKK